MLHMSSLQINQTCQIIHTALGLVLVTFRAEDHLTIAGAMRNGRVKDKVCKGSASALSAQSTRRVFL